MAYSAGLRKIAYTQQKKKKAEKPLTKNQKAKAEEARLRELAFLDGLEAELEQAKERRSQQPRRVNVRYDTNAHIPRREIW